MNTEIFEKVKKIIAEQLDVSEDTITPKTDLVNDLGYTPPSNAPIKESMEGPELIMAIEEYFNIHISSEAAEKLTTVQDFVDYIA